MNELSRQQLVRLLDDLTAALQIPFVWKATAAMLVQVGLPPCHRLHIHPFCCAVKGQGRDYELRCMRNDAELVSRRALAERRPFVHLCHAGAAELIVPVFRGDHYLGALMCGPFQSGSVSPEAMSTAVAAAYAALSPLEPERADAIARLAGQAMDSVAELGPVESGRQLCASDMISDPRIRAASDHLRRHFRQRISAAVVARQNALSPSRFLHLFTLHTGMSFSEMLQRLRADAAADLLRSTALRMDEIADACGFTDQSRLAAVFRRYYGLTPLVYRRQSFSCDSA